VARRLLLRPAVGERLLTTKLQILSGVGPRRPSLALSILTGRVAHTDDIEIVPEPLKLVSAPQRLHARTVYLAERHLHDLDRIIQAWQLAEPRRLTRSAVLRRAVEHLRSAVDADPAKSLLENE
jgi:hypothetical protein